MAALMCAITMTATTRALAHGFEGDRFFPPTVSTDDPFATDEYSVTFQQFNDPAGSDGTPKTHEIDVSSEFDKEIFPKFALGVSGTYINLDPANHQGPAQDGFDNIELSAKFQLWENAVHEWILSIGGTVDLGDTGSKALGVDSFTTYTPTVYFGKGFGDLPDAVKYLKPIALTGTVGVSIPGQSQNFDGSTNSDALQLGFALEYSLPYLEQHVEDIGLPRPLPRHDSARGIHQLVAVRPRGGDDDGHGVSGHSLGAARFSARGGGAHSDQRAYRAECRVRLPGANLHR